MWTTKISFDGSSGVAVAIHAKKNNVRFLCFPLSWNYRKSDISISLTGILFGETKDKKQFVKDWKHDKSGWLEEIELNGDFFIATSREPIVAKKMFNKNIIFTEPFSIDENGIEIITISSFEKKYLEEYIKVLESFYQVKVHYIKQEKIKNILFKAKAPELTDKQKSSMELALRSGYYNYPRKTSIEKMAKKSKIAFSAFHGHLRKAEQKLMPFFFSH